MEYVVSASFLFMIGSICGWVIEVIFRNFIKKNRVKGVWVNPGFCTGPWLPIYGIGLSTMFFIAFFQSIGLVGNSVWHYIVLFISIAITMTIIEFIGGLILLKVLHMRLWDYRGKKGNIMGIICPQFSLIWAVAGALYYFLVHPLAFKALDWLGDNILLTYFVGAFMGIFVLDLLYSNSKARVIKEFGKDKEVILLYEELKFLIQKREQENDEKTRKFFQTGTGKAFKEELNEYTKAFENNIKDREEKESEEKEN